MLYICKYRFKRNENLMYIVFNIFNQNKYLFLLKIQPFEMPIPVVREESYKVYKVEISFILFKTNFSFLDLNPP